jgi:hypothetical protein
MAPLRELEVVKVDGCRFNSIAFAPGTIPAGEDPTLWRYKLGEAVYPPGQIVHYVVAAFLWFGGDDPRAYRLEYEDGFSAQLRIMEERESALTGVQQASA